MLFPKLLFFVCSLQLFRTVQANHVLFSIFELGSKVPKIVTSSHNQTIHVLVVTLLTKREHRILYLGEINTFFVQLCKSLVF